MLQELNNAVERYPLLKIVRREKLGRAGLFVEQPAGQQRVRTDGLLRQLYVDCEWRKLMQLAIDRGWAGAAD